MNERKIRKPLKRIKSGAFERRFAMAKAGVVASTMFATQSAGNLFRDKESRQIKQKEILSMQAQYLVDEIGKLKGSIVKIGQIMALWGEHFLPEEVTLALHTLEDDTTTVAWSFMYKALEDQLGPEKLADLEIDEIPIGAASLGQVHLAKRKSDGKLICLKIQYPGVSDAIDSDLNTVANLLRLTRLVPITEEFEQWLDEIRMMMKREVDYVLEKESTVRFKGLLKDDSRYIVPSIYPEYSTDQILATSYEPGVNFNSPEFLGLSQNRRNHIAQSCMELCWREVFEWGEMQTDPNFGNFFIRLGDDTTPDRLVLIDFGAVREFSAETIGPGKLMIEGAFKHDKQIIRQALIDLKFMKEDTPDRIILAFTDMICTAIEPFADIEKHPPPANLLTKNGEYKWAESDLAARTLLKASQSAFSVHFAIPPREFMFLSRKLIGSFTLMSVISAELKGHDILAKFID
ncbi:MAG: AarF/ABC1/UbiB kinase family protein [Pseudomonadales bacterium]|nr:AarF/ABC1/UbiB kinase family protein [Pseudomonadales bacterium]